MKALSGILLLALLINVLSLSAYAQNPTDPNLPERGTSQQQIKEKYGFPDEQISPVGDPPISRWIYPHFTVVFEHDRAIHAFKRSTAIENLPIRDRRDAITIPDRNTQSATTEETLERNILEQDSPFATQPDINTDNGSLFIEEDSNTQNEDPSYNEDQNEPDREENQPFSTNEYEIDSTYESDIPID